MTAPSFSRYAPNDAHWYVPSRALRVAVNTALAAEQPLLLTGEPGTGKTVLARSVAEVLDLGDVLTFHTRSDHQARDCLYYFDALKRLYDAQTHDPRALDPRAYVEPRALGLAIQRASPGEDGAPPARKAPSVVLIDEIDKAPRDFPNDLLDVVDAMRFEIRETGATYKADKGLRPILVVTSNSEKQLPEPFLRRCVFHHVEFPSKDDLEKIVAKQLGDLAPDKALATRAIERFIALRADATIERKPATAELLVWLRVLVRAGELAKAADPAVGWAELYAGTLLKTADDLRTIAGREA